MSQSLDPDPNKEQSGWISEGSRFKIKLTWKFKSVNEIVMMSQIIERHLIYGLKKTQNRTKAGDILYKETPLRRASRVLYRGRGGW